jgi:hypothetical protein
MYYFFFSSIFALSEGDKKSIMHTETAQLVH